MRPGSRRPWLSLLALLALAPGCVRETVSCADQPSAVCPQDAAGPDTGGLDGGPPGADAFSPDSPIDGGPCSRCPATLPVCVMDTCVECDGNEDCGSTADETLCSPSHECVECLSPSDCGMGLRACTPAGACVECDDNPDCTSPTGSRCDTSGAAPTCAPCAMDGDCAHIPDRPYCEDGVCVECRLATERDDCGGFSCNPATNACTGTMVNGVAQCLSCVADSECMTGHVCAPVNPARGVTGTYCLPRRTGACVRPLFEGATVNTASGERDVPICRHATATCEAFLMHRLESTIGAESCSASGPVSRADAACGTSGVDDGLCRTSSGGTNLCTYACANDFDCPAGFACIPDASEPRFGRSCALDPT